MSNSIVFIDVEDADQAFVKTQYPDAIFLSHEISDDDLVHACKDASVICCFITTRLPASVLEKLPNLKLICTRSVGFDHIDIPTCIKQGITVCNVPDYGSHVIAEHVYALLLSTLRHIPSGGMRVQKGTFDYRGLRGMALKDKTIAIIGTGKIGRAAVRIAHGFDMKILVVDQYQVPSLETDFGAKYVPLEEALAAADIVSLHVPATPETYHLIGTEKLQMMKRGAILVNTARGSLIDSDALLAALNSGQISHALLDVLEHEHDLELSRELIQHPRVVVTPHIAFYADDSLGNMYRISLQSIREWLEGKTPEYNVNLEQAAASIKA